MTLNLDTVIFIIFLLSNLAVGLFYSRGVKTMREYAIGNRDFSTYTIATTVIATYIGAGFITAALNESYRQGLYFMIPILGEPLMLIVTGYFLIPRMNEFLGKISVAEAMGDLYGTPVRLITAMSGMFKAAGIVAFQFVIASEIMGVFFGTDSFFVLALSSVIIVLYSSFGGIKAVTFTDILQFAFIGIALPLICISIWKTSSTAKVFFILSNDPLFDYKKILSMHNPRIVAMICLFLYFILPPIDSAYFQRISMSKNISQAKRGFIIGGIVGGAILLIVCWSGILIYSSNSHLEPNSMLTYILENHAYHGFKGVAAAGIIAAIMSTADSYLNSASVLAYDFIITISPNSIKPEKELRLLRIATLIIGIIAFVMAYFADSLIGILVMSVTFYVPIVSVPLLLAIFGFRSSTKVVLIGMVAGGVTALLWSDFYSNVQFDGFGKVVIEETNEAIPAMLANLIVFTIAHLICGKPRESDSILHNASLKLPETQRKYSIRNVLSTIKTFSFLRFCQSISLKKETFYFFSGFFSFISIFSTTYLVSTETQNLYTNLLDSIYHSTLIVSTVLMTYPIWSLRYKSDKFIAIFWAIAAPYIFICVPTMLVVINNLNQFQIILFMINIIIFISLVRWQAALVILMLSLYLSVKVCELFTNINVASISSDDIGIKFKITYALVFISGIIIAFFKPKQENQELSEEMVEHLTGRIEKQSEELNKAMALKEEFLRNLPHEANTPLTGVCSLSQALSECYDKLTEKQRRKAVNTIAENSERLISYVNNMIDISKLISLNYSLTLKKVNLSDIVHYAVRRCKKLYIPQKAEEDRDFVVNIDARIMVMCDEYYMSRTVENIIINAIQYCSKGQIVVTLASIKKDQAQNQEQNNLILFTVKDAGIGIAKQELHSIFNAFTTSSKTRTVAGGRGIGLTLVKATVEAHGGKITVESAEGVGSTFTIVLPGTV